MSELSQYLNGQKKKFIVARETVGATPRAFREYIGGLYTEDTEYFVKMALDAVMEATTHVWQRQPRREGPDLFDIGGHTIPEFLTRPRRGYVPGVDPDLDDADAFETVDQQFATIQDGYDDATIKLRKAAQSASAAERQMKAIDEANKRAKGDRSKLLKEVSDAMAVILEPA